MATGQQVQQQEQYATAVRLARPGYFQQSGVSSSSSSFQNDRFQDSSFQSGVQNNQRATAQSVNSQLGNSGSLQANDQFQFSVDKASNQFQSNSFQQNQQNAFDSSLSRQEEGNRFQTRNFQTADRIQLTENQQNSRNVFQSSVNDFNSGSLSQTTSNQASSGSQFISNQQGGAANRFLSSVNQGTLFQTNDNLEATGNSANQRNTATTSSFQVESNQRNAVSNFQANNQQTSSSNSQSNFNQGNANSRFSQNSQSSSSSLVGSSFEGSSAVADGVFEPLNLPSGASVLLGSISTSFSCLDRPYGYYADQENSCRVFHVCYPALFSTGAVETYQYRSVTGLN